MMQLTDCFPADYVVVDTETSGLNPYLGRVLEIGVAEVKNREIALPHSWVLNPNFPDDGFEVPEKITTITGITTEEVAEGQDPALVLARLQGICNQKMIFTHNGIRFDRLFLDEEYKRWEYEFFFANFDKHQFLDTAALYKGQKLNMLPYLKHMSFFNWANRVLKMRAFGVYYNLAYCCEVLGVDVSDLGTAHRAVVDVVMVHRVVERLREVLLEEENK